MLTKGSLKINRRLFLSLTRRRYHKPLVLNLKPQAKNLRFRSAPHGTCQHLLLTADILVQKGCLNKSKLALIIDMVDYNQRLES